MSIVLKDLELWFDEDKPVLNRFSLELPERGLVLITGPSGCGKTSLLKVIAGLLTPHSGSVEGLDDKHISMVFSEDVLLPWLTVFQNVVLGSGERNSHALHALTRVGLDGSLDLFPDELSAGMQRRVAIARALAFNSDILILDEPTNSLDAALAQDIMEYIITTGKDRLIVCVTHDTNLIKTYAESLISVTGPPLHLV